MVMDTPHRHELDLLTGFLGVPGYILSTFLPSIQHYAARQPRIVKALGIFIALTTVGFSVLERAKRILLSFLVSYFMFSTTIDANDPLYTYVLRWLRNHRKILPEQELQARSKEDIDRNQADWAPRLLHQAGSKAQKDDVVYDFTGLQVFWHNHRPYFVSPYPYGKIGSPSHLTVRCFGFSSQPLREIVNEAWATYRKKDQARLTAVYRPIARIGGWKCVARKDRRSLDTIVLDSEEKESLFEDVKFYLASEAKEWYAARGIPYRRGYLFHGRPGTGKTSLSMAVAGHFGLDIYIISLQDPQINDTFLHAFFTNLPKGALILLEDIDSAGLTREAFDKSLVSYKSGGRARSSRTSTGARVTLSGLLNAIDGADSPEGHVLIMTTNAPEALDDALVRPGRIDYKIGFKAILPIQARAIFMRMYQGDVDEKVDLNDLADQFGAQIPNDVFTPAELQGHLLRHKRKPAEALDRLEEWKQSVYRERSHLEEARRKEAEDAEKRKKHRKTKAKASQARANVSESDTEDISAADDMVLNMDYFDHAAEYYDSLIAERARIERDTGPGTTQSLTTHHTPSDQWLSQSLRDLRKHRSKNSEVRWDDLNGKERTCVVM